MQSEIWQDWVLEPAAFGTIRVCTDLGVLVLKILHFGQDLYQYSSSLWDSSSPTLELAVVKVLAASSRIVGNRANEKDWNKNSLGVSGRGGKERDLFLGVWASRASGHPASLGKALSLLLPRYLEGFPFLPPWQLFCLTRSSSTGEMIFLFNCSWSQPWGWTTPGGVKDIPYLWHYGSRTAWWKKKSLAVELDP